MEIKIKMIDFKHLQGNLVISVTGVGLSYLGKKFLKKEFMPANSIKQAGISFGFLMIVTILGKKTMDEMARFNWVSFTATGKAKHPNEGFIGPLENENIFFGPDRRNKQIIQDMKKDNRRQ